MLLRFVLVGLVLLPLVVLLPWAIIRWRGHNQTYTIQTVPERRAAVVFGAGLWRNGSPTPVLSDRVATAAELYFEGKVQLLLMSGWRSSERYDEPGAMRAYAIQLGVPEQAILLDYAGARSYDTCYRAQALFDLQEVVLVTQRFHLSRALFLCNRLGLPAVGVEADRRIYHRASSVYWNLREMGASLSAVWDIYVSRPVPDLSKNEMHIPMEAQ
ncbi:MAG: vancomycin high temperature exclusion protein [Chloroflexota bacterium]